MSTVLVYYGLSINKNKHLNCPFHDDKTPSMKVFMESGVGWCFSGNCQHSDRNLDVIEFVMLKESCNKHEAIMKCKSLLGWKATTVESPQKTIWRILRKRMGQTEKAKSYLKARGLNQTTKGWAITLAIGKEIMPKQLPYVA